jgi:hypothetical protein
MCLQAEQDGQNYGTLRFRCVSCAAEPDRWPGCRATRVRLDIGRNDVASSHTWAAVMIYVRREDRGCVHLELVREEAEAFPAVTDPSRYESARIWFCAFRSLSGLGRLQNLRKLEVAGYPESSLDPLRALNRLEHLSMVHLPGVKSLAPLASLAALRRLTLAALPARDPAAVTMEIPSLAPLHSLPALEEINLFGVRPADRSVKWLWRMPSLRRVRLADYPPRRSLSVELADRW